jgi:hypothetical protein
MVVMIEERHSDGTRRQCNSRCHSAKRPKCTCICGGKYHGAARDTARAGELVDYREADKQQVLPFPI